MSISESKTLVIRNGTLIDGSGLAAAANTAVVIQGNRISSVGELPGEVNLEDTDKVDVIDATGQWIMPGLIDGHCHLSFGMPAVQGYASARGTINPGFSAIRAAANAQTILRSGVTSVSIPGGTWFIEVGLRDAINAGLIEGPRIYTAGRFIITYGSIADSEPSWVGAPEHTYGVLANNVTDMITEVRRQTKHGVDFIKLADSTWGDTQTIAKEEISAVVEEAHRRNARISIHSRGAGSTKAAAEAGVDWIMHADLATEAELYAVAEAGVRIMPTMTFLFEALEVGKEKGRSDAELDIIKRNADNAVTVLQTARSLGVQVMSGTDTGNSPVMPYGVLHAHEAEVMVKFGGYTPLEAITASTKDNAYSVGMEGELGVIEAGKLADLLILDADPLDDIRVLQGGKHLNSVIKDGRRVDLSAQPEDETVLALP
ncbi:MAG TPA: amidohydrolase family protein [Dehalococcoidia bacterium]|nr:amidohydrolase family protein [Dehalococcoidia bacterium]